MELSRFHHDYNLTILPRIFQPDDVLSYMEMCSTVGVNLQRGMNFRLRAGTSVDRLANRPANVLNTSHPIGIIEISRTEFETPNRKRRESHLDLQSQAAGFPIATAEVAHVPVAAIQGLLLSQKLAGLRFTSQLPYSNK